MLEKNGNEISPRTDTVCSLCNRISSTQKRKSLSRARALNVLSRTQCALAPFDRGLADFRVGLCISERGIVSDLRGHFSESAAAGASHYSFDTSIWRRGHLPARNSAK